MHSGKRPLSPESMAGKREEKKELCCCSTLSESDVSAFVSELTEQPTPPSIGEGNLIRSFFAIVLLLYFITRV